MRLKLGQKIIAGYFLVIVFMVLVGYFGITGMNTIEEQYQKVDLHRTISTHIWELSNNYNSQFAHAQVYLLTGAVDAKDGFYALMENTEALVEETNKLDLGADDKTKLDDITARNEEFCGDIGEVFELVAAGNTAAANQLLVEVDTDLDA
ncbi:MAG: MCP four helix bundle domain-containing protein, partial [Dehalococcoidales bacterium]|nr:MCP four helix bundle domain-containing protein [Dehalococcoidales bacterium]